MIRLLFLVAVVIGALYLLRWFLNTPASDVAASLKKSLLLAVGLGLLLLAATGRLHWLFAFLGAAIPLLMRHLPTVFRLLGLAGAVRAAHNRRKSRPGGPQQQSDTHRTPRGRAQMSREQALEVLGLPEDANREAIIRAHRTLIQKVHPDRGGSSHLAAQINQAKDVLLDDEAQHS